MEIYKRKPDVSVRSRFFLDSFISRIGHLSQTVRLAFHVLSILLIVSIDVILFYTIVGTDRLVLTALTTVVVIQNLLVFYGAIYWGLPKLFYKRKVGQLAIVVLISFWCAYLLNRAAIFAVEPNLPQAIRYITRIRSIVGPAGLLGCFSSLRVLLWNFVLVSLAPLIPLGVKIMQSSVVFRQKQFELKRNRLLLDRDNTLLKLNFLKAQVSPHFLFNTLNSIYARVIDVDEQAADLVLRLAELMRYNLYEASVSRVPLIQEMDYIKSYIILEQARHGNRLTVSFHMPIATADYLIAPLLLSTYVENAFKHGIKSDRHGSYIFVDVRLDGATLHFTVENSLSQGVTRNTSQRAGGVGLPNARKRLDLQYPNRYTLTQDSTDDYYRVTLQIMLEVQPVTASSAQTPAI